MATTNLGKVSVTPKGEYDPLITYERLDVISHNGSSYIVKQASTGVTPIEGEFYALIAEKGDGGSFVKKAYKTYAAMDADKANIPANSSVDVTNDLDESKNGAYIYDGEAFTRSQYDSKVVTDKIIADTAIAVQDAINNTAVEGGVLADTLVTVTANNGTQARTQRSKNSELVSVKDFGAKGDGITDDSDDIQDNIDYTEANKVPYIFFPTNTENYLIKKPIVFTDPGVNIFGFKGATYERGEGKHGNIIVHQDAEYAINIGNFRSTDTNPEGKIYNPADAWTIKNIGIKNDVGVAKRTKDGIRITTATDGPDRGGCFRELSINFMDKAVNFTKQSIYVDYASVLIENSCMYGNNLAVFAEGNIYGARIVGNQMEQNFQGGIHGAFDGPVYITDNMLEGQRDAVNIYPSAGGNKLKLHVARNYFEGNYGDYAIRVRTASSEGSVVVRDNYMVHATVKDYLLIDTSAMITVINDDPYPTTFTQSPTVVADSRLFSRGKSSYRVRKNNSNSGGALLFLNPNDVSTPTSGTYTNKVFTRHEAIPSPWGRVKNAKINTIEQTVYMDINEGDLLNINLLIYIDDTFRQQYAATNTPAIDTIFHLQFFLGSGSTKIGESSVIISSRSLCKKSGWFVLNTTIRATTGGSGWLLFQMNKSGLSGLSPDDLKAFTDSYRIAAMSVKNEGFIPTDGSAHKDITPVLPSVSNYITDVVHSIDQLAVTANSTVTINIPLGVTGLDTSTNSASIDFIGWSNNIVFSKIGIIGGNTLRVLAYNPTASNVTVTGKLKVNIYNS